MEQFVWPPPVLLEICAKYHGHDLQFFRGNVEITDAEVRCDDGTVTSLP